MAHPSPSCFLVTTFTSDPFGGNPAAVVFLDTTSVPVERLCKLAQNLNQPMLAVLSKEPLPSDEPGVLAHSIRYFVPINEITLCGHATLAASKVLFSSPEVQARGIHTLVFETAFGATIKAIQRDNGFIEIEIPSPADVISVSPEEVERLKGFVDRTFGRSVLVKDIKVGKGGNYSGYVLVELDESEDLAGSVLDGKELFGTGFVINVFTTRSPSDDAVFVSRVFAPLLMPDGSPEDHVCGSAHGLLTLYWSSKLGIVPGEEIRAKQVSARGGDLRVVWNKDNGSIKLRGQCVLLVSGDLHL